MLKRVLNLRTLSIVNAMAMAVVVFLEAFHAERNGIGSLLVTVPQAVLLVPTVLVLICTLAWRRWRFATLNGFVLILGGFMVLSPSFGSADQTTQADLKVMTYNIMMGEMGIDGVLDTIAKEHPDVVCLQEANLHRSNLFLPYRMSLRLPEYQVVYKGDMLIAARHEMSTGRLVPLDGQGAEREFMIVDVTINGHHLTVANVHLIHPGYDRITQRLLSAPQIARETYSMRIEQVKTTLRALSSVRTPLVLCGDMNSQPKGTFYRLLRSQLTDTWDATNVGLGYSFHSKRPYARIDYIWSNTRMKPLRSKVLTTPYSDHFPVLTEFTWRRD